VAAGDKLRDRVVKLLRAMHTVPPVPPKNERGLARWRKNCEETGKAVREAYDLLEQAHLRYLQAASLGDRGRESLSPLVAGAARNLLRPCLDLHSAYCVATRGGLVRMSVRMCLDALCDTYALTPSHAWCVHLQLAGRSKRCSRQRQARSRRKRRKSGCGSTPTSSQPRLPPLTVRADNVRYIPPTLLIL
jgi:hypothetical protein